MEQTDVKDCESLSLFVFKKRAETALSGDAAAPAMS